MSDRHPPERRSHTPMTTISETIELGGVTAHLWVSPVNGGITVQIDTADTAPGQTVNVDLNDGRLYSGDPDKRAEPEFIVDVTRDEAGTITDVRMTCPVPDCGSENLAAIEQDEVWRPMRVHEVYNGEVDITIGESKSDAPEDDGYVCRECGTRLTAPTVFETFDINYH